MRSNTIGSRIQHLRESRGLTQANLAVALEVKRETINQWESGTRQIKAEHIAKLATHLGVTADYILGISLVETNDIQIKGVCDYLSLDEESIAIIRNYPKAVRQLLSSENITDFLHTFESIPIIMEIVERYSNLALSLIAETMNESLDLSDVPDHNYSFLKAISSELDHFYSKLRLAVFEFSEQAKQLAETNYNIRATLRNTKRALDTSNAIVREFEEAEGEDGE